MKPTEKHIEAAARAICIAQGYDPKTLDNVGSYSGLPLWKDKMGSAEAALSAALAVEAGTAGHLPVELDGVADAIAYGKGFWRSCSGCHETNEGVPIGPFSGVLKCHLGGGCFECGGVGAIWDTTDYEEMGRFLSGEALTTSPASSDTCQRCQGNGEIVTDWERYKHPHEGDKGDEAVAECPDCSGTGYPDATEEDAPFVASPASSGVEGERCPICAEVFKPTDLCASDIEMGTCHAACLEGSPVVDLDTGEPSDGPIHTYRFDEDEAAIRDVIAERRRQIEAEGFDASHDDMATKGQLATAAACYAFQGGARGRLFPADPNPIGIWPWDREWWKPATDHRRNLVKAAALAIAEIERLDRAVISPTEKKEVSDGR